MRGAEGRSEQLVGEGEILEDAEGLFILKYVRDATSDATTVCIINRNLTPLSVEEVEVVEVIDGATSEGVRGVEDPAPVLSEDPVDRDVIPV